LVQWVGDLFCSFASVVFDWNQRKRNQTGEIRDGSGQSPEFQTMGVQRRSDAARLNACRASPLLPARIMSVAHPIVPATSSSSVRVMSPPPSDAPMPLTVVSYSDFDSPF